MLGCCLLAVTGCSDSSDTTVRHDLVAAAGACADAVDTTLMLCKAECDRLPDSGAAAGCYSGCSASHEETGALCASPPVHFARACASGDCVTEINECLVEAVGQYDACAANCAAGNDYCRNRCLENRAAAQTSCGFLPAALVVGGAALPVFEPGRAAFLPGLLDDAELAVVEAADRRAAAHRQREVRLWVGSGNAPVAVTQVEHAFRFGVPLDSREFEDGDGRLDFYGDIARRHTSLLVAETSLKWRNTEREAGALTFDLADFELEWAEALGFDVKAHVLLWGNPPPLASGSGTPDWLRERFADADLDAGEREELRGLIRERIVTTVGRYSGRIDVWEVTNEMLNPITSWFVDRLGPTVVEDAFRWAREADPGAELVYNEWISDIFTGLGGPDALAVRDRVQELRALGVQVDALGQQGHFAPGLVNIGVDVDLSARTRVDDYALALEALAEPGLPIHITEVTFAAPDEPELRAAQAEAILRIWWGHPQVEEIIFWNFWNPLGPRSHLDLGIYDDDGNLSRHGEAVLSLLNDRWRTQVEGQTGPDGSIAFTATLGEHIARWDTPDGPVHVRFDVAGGERTLDVVAVPATPDR